MDDSFKAHDVGRERGYRAALKVLTEFHPNRVSFETIWGKYFVSVDWKYTNRKNERRNLRRFLKKHANCEKGWVRGELWSLRQAPLKPLVPYRIVCQCGLLDDLDGFDDFRFAADGRKHAFGSCDVDRSTIPHTKEHEQKLFNGMNDSLMELMTALDKWYQARRKYEERNK
jgi:hypothetical protein